ncbi:glycosyltransferase family 2 protein [Candidatus Kaiserbacteria bacterium]|nr:glycosyltransferase family 2 protein [Candidatus Kaiserbacteria bacterium]
MRTISIILPATDETFSLEETVRSIAQLLPSREIEYLIVTHPKLTTAACRETIEKLRTTEGPRIVAFDQTRPRIGGAVRDAIDRTQGEVIVLMAADLETDPSVLPAMLQKIDEGYDIVATSRWRGRARFSGYDPLKLLLNFFFQHFFRLLYWTSLTDLTYAYRAYRAPVLKAIRWEEMGFPFLFESILKPLRLQYRATEVEAPWHRRREGVSHNSFWQTCAYTWTGLRVRFQSRKKMLYSGAQ